MKKNWYYLKSSSHRYKHCHSRPTQTERRTRHTETRGPKIEEHVWYNLYNCFEIKTDSKITDGAEKIC